MQIMSIYYHIQANNGMMPQNEYIQNIFYIQKNFDSIEILSLSHRISVIISIGSVLATLISRDKAIHSI